MKLTDFRTICVRFVKRFNFVRVVHLNQKCNLIPIRSFKPVSDFYISARVLIVFIKGLEKELTISTMYRDVKENISYSNLYHFFL